MITLHYSEPTSKTNFIDLTNKSIYLSCLGTINLNANYPDLIIFSRSYPGRISSCINDIANVT